MSLNCCSADDPSSRNVTLLLLIRFPSSPAGRTPTAQERSVIASSDALARSAAVPDVALPSAS